MIEYDSLRHRLWILGQRCHHGAGGAAVAAVAAAGLLAAPISRQAPPAPLIALVATGGALMAHDWKDRSYWFELGHGSQP